MEYLINVIKTSETNAEQIVFQVNITRDGTPISTWVVRFDPTIADPSIRTELIRRIREYIKLDSGNILTEQVDERAEAIAASLDGHLEVI